MYPFHQHFLRLFVCREYWAWTFRKWLAWSNRIVVLINDRLQWRGLREWMERSGCPQGRFLRQCYQYGNARFGIKIPTQKRKPIMALHNGIVLLKWYLSYLTTPPQYFCFDNLVREWGIQICIPLDRATGRKISCAGRNNKSSVTGKQSLPFSSSSYCKIGIHVPLWIF